MQRTDSQEETLMLGKIVKAGEGDVRGWDGWMASLTRWTWASSGSWWWTGKPGMLQSVGLQRVRQTERLNWYVNIFSIFVLRVIYGVVQWLRERTLWLNWIQTPVLLFTSWTRFMVSYLSPVFVTSLVCKIEILISLTSQSCCKIKCDNTCKVLRTMNNVHLNPFVYLWRLIRTWYFLVLPRVFLDPLWWSCFTSTKFEFFLWSAPPMSCMFLEYSPHCSSYLDSTCQASYPSLFLLPK